MGIGGFLFPLLTASNLISPHELSDAVDGYWLDKRLAFSRHTITGYRLIVNRLISYLGTGSVRFDIFRIKNEEARLLSAAEVKADSLAIVIFEAKDDYCP